MISGMVMVFVAIWIYQSAMKAKSDNVMIWVAGGAALFFTLVFLLQYININILEWFGFFPTGVNWHQNKKAKINYG